MAWQECGWERDACSNTRGLHLKEPPGKKAFENIGRYIDGRLKTGFASDCGTLGAIRQASVHGMGAIVL